jgi:ubiquinone/menaquinone biosynthesis C-methylase UbiE
MGGEVSSNEGKGEDDEMTQEAQPEPKYPIEAENVAEMARLIKQARSVTQALGLLPASLDLSQTTDILDLACGPGDWAITMAQRLPQARVTGFDLSRVMIEYAQSWAISEGIGTARFLVQDALQPLPFPDASFNLIHGRFLISFVPTIGWPSLLQECVRLLRPGGMLCWKEGEHPGITPSVALTRFQSLLVAAYRRNGQCFTISGDNFGITVVQEGLLRQAGLVPILREAYGIDVSYGQDAYLATLDNYRALMTLMQPFLVRVLDLSAQEVQALTHECLREMRDPAFQMLGYGQTVVGQKLGGRA